MAAFSEWLHSFGFIKALRIRTLIKTKLKHPKMLNEDDYSNLFCTLFAQSKLLITRCHVKQFFFTLFFFTNNLWCKKPWTRSTKENSNRESCMSICVMYIKYIPIVIRKIVKSSFFFFNYFSSWEKRYGIVIDAIHS